VRGVTKGATHNGVPQGNGDCGGVSVSDKLALRLVCWVLWY